MVSGSAPHSHESVGGQAPGVILTYVMQIGCTRRQHILGAQSIIARGKLGLYSGSPLIQRLLYSRHTPVVWQELIEGLYARSVINRVINIKRNHSALS